MGTTIYFGALKQTTAIEDPNCTTTNSELNTDTQYAYNLMHEFDVNQDSVLTADELSYLTPGQIFNVDEAVKDLTSNMRRACPISSLLSGSCERLVRNLVPFTLSFGDEPDAKAQAKAKKAVQDRLTDHGFGLVEFQLVQFDTITDPNHPAMLLAGGSGLERNIRTIVSLDPKNKNAIKLYCEQYNGVTQTNTLDLTTGSLSLPINGTWK